MEFPPPPLQAASSLDASSSKLSSLSTTGGGTSAVLASPFVSNGSAIALPRNNFSPSAGGVASWMTVAPSPSSLMDRAGTSNRRQQTRGGTTAVNSSASGHRYGDDVTSWGATARRWGAPRRVATATVSTASRGATHVSAHVAGTSSHVAAAATTASAIGDRGNAFGRQGGRVTSSTGVPMSSVSSSGRMPFQRPAEVSAVTLPYSYGSLLPLLAQDSAAPPPPLSPLPADRSPAASGAGLFTPQPRGNATGRGSGHRTGGKQQTAVSSAGAETGGGGGESDSNDLAGARKQRESTLPCSGSPSSASLHRPPRSVGDAERSGQPQEAATAGKSEEAPVKSDRAGKSEEAPVKIHRAGKTEEAPVKVDRAGTPRVLPSEELSKIPGSVSGSQSLLLSNSATESLARLTTSADCVERADGCSHGEEEDELINSSSSSSSANSNSSSSNTSACRGQSPGLDKMNTRSSAMSGAACDKGGERDSCGSGGREISGAAVKTSTRESNVLATTTKAPSTTVAVDGGARRVDKSTSTTPSSLAVREAVEPIPGCKQSRRSVTSSSSSLAVTAGNGSGGAEEPTDQRIKSPPASGGLVLRQQRVAGSGTGGLLATAAPFTKKNVGAGGGKMEISGRLTAEEKPPSSSSSSSSTRTTTTTTKKSLLPYSQPAGCASDEAQSLAEGDGDDQFDKKEAKMMEERSTKADAQLLQPDDRSNSNHRTQQSERRPMAATTTTRKKKIAAAVSPRAARPATATTTTTVANSSETRTATGGSSGYRVPSPGSCANFNHIIIESTDDDDDNEDDDDDDDDDDDLFCSASSSSSLSRQDVISTSPTKTSQRLRRPPPVTRKLNEQQQDLKTNDRDFHTNTNTQKKNVMTTTKTTTTSWRDSGSRSHLNNNTQTTTATASSRRTPTSPPDDYFVSKANRSRSSLDSDDAITPRRSHQQLQQKRPTNVSIAPPDISPLSSSASNRPKFFLDLGSLNKLNSSGNATAIAPSADRQRSSAQWTASSESAHRQNHGQQQPAHPIPQFSIPSLSPSSSSSSAVNGVADSSDRWRPTALASARMSTRRPDDYIVLDDGLTVMSARGARPLATTTTNSFQRHAAMAVGCHLPLDHHPSSPADNSSSTSSSKFSTAGKVLNLRHLPQHRAHVPIERNSIHSLVTPRLMPNAFPDWLPIVNSSATPPPTHHGGTKFHQPGSNQRTATTTTTRNHTNRIPVGGSSSQQQQQQQQRAVPARGGTTIVGLPSSECGALPLLTSARSREQQPQQPLSPCHLTLPQPPRAIAMASPTSQAARLSFSNSAAERRRPSTADGDRPTNSSSSSSTSSPSMNRLLPLQPAASVTAEVGSAAKGGSVSGSNSALRGNIAEFHKIVATDQMNHNDKEAVLGKGRILKHDETSAQHDDDNNNIDAAARGDDTSRRNGSTKTEDNRTKEVDEDAGTSMAAVAAVAADPPWMQIGVAPGGDSGPVVFGVAAAASHRISSHGAAPSAAACGSHSAATAAPRGSMNGGRLRDAPVAALSPAAVFTPRRRGALSGEELRAASSTGGAGDGLQRPRLPRWFPAVKAAGWGKTGKRGVDDTTPREQSTPTGDPPQNDEDDDDDDVANSGSHHCSEQRHHPHLIPDASGSYRSPHHHHYPHNHHHQEFQQRQFRQHQSSFSNPSLNVLNSSTSSSIADHQQHHHHHQHQYTAYPSSHRTGTLSTHPHSVAPRVAAVGAHPSSLSTSQNGHNTQSSAPRSRPPLLNFMTAAAASSSNHHRPITNFYSMHPTLTAGGNLPSTGNLNQQSPRMATSRWTFAQSARSPSATSSSAGATAHQHHHSSAGQTLSSGRLRGGSSGGRDEPPTSSSPHSHHHHHFPTTLTGGTGSRVSRRSGTGNITGNDNRGNAACELLPPVPTPADCASLARMSSSARRLLDQTTLDFRALAFDVVAHPTAPRGGGGGHCVGNQFGGASAAGELSKHQILAVINSGTFCTVYSGRFNGERVAIKCPQPQQMRADPEMTRRRALLEWLILARVAHPNVLSFRGGIAYGRDVWLVTEIVTRGDLYSLLHHKPEHLLSAAKRLDIIEQIVSALEYLHERISPKVAHKDLKSNNILVDENLNAKLCDFGDAEELTGKHLKCYTAATWQYAPPEIIAAVDPALPIGATEKVDIWSYGCIALEVCKRPTPFEYLLREVRDDAQQLPCLKHALLHKTLQPRVSNLPPLLHSVITDCLNLNHAARPKASEIRHFISSNRPMLLREMQWIVDNDPHTPLPPAFSRHLHQHPATRQSASTLNGSGVTGAASKSPFTVAAR